MKKVLVAMLLMLSCGTASATTAWTPSSMGAGGDFCAADINSDGVVLVGSDVSGIYRRASNTGDWTRIGYQDGLDCTHIFSLRFMDAEPNKVIAGTSRGFYFSSSAGASLSWNRVTSTHGPTKNVGAVCWANDGNNAGTCLGVFNNDDPAADDKVYFSVSTNYGHDWTKGASLVEVVSQSFTSGNDPERQPIKIAADPSTSGSTREIYVLMGIIAGNNVAGAEEAAAYDSASKHFPPRYRDLYQSRDNGATWRQLVAGNVVDFAIDSTAAHHVAIALSNSNYVSGNRYGVIKTTNDASQNSVTWNTETVDNNHTDKEPTGAIWYKNGDLYLLTVQQDPCGGSSNPTTGVWVKSGGSWALVDDGQGGGSWSADTWESGWTVSGSSPCGLRYGQTIANSAQSVSPRGEYRVTASFVWQYDWGAASGRGYKSSFTNSGGGPYTGKKIDNVNVAALYLDGADLWAGYYDVGLWKLGGSGWENHNATGFGTWDGNGGNVNGITKQGSTMYVCAASSSKGDDWKVWSNTNNGSGYPAADWSQLSDLSAYARGLSVGAWNASPYYQFWITAGGVVKHSSDATSWTSSATGANNLSSNARYTSVNTSLSGWVLVGGREGIWTNSNYGVDGYWIKALDFGSDLGGTIDQTETWIGVHDIYYEPTSGIFYAAVYDKSSGTSGKGGIWKSTDNGTTWSRIIDKLQCRSVVADSCGARIIFTTAEEFSSGPNSTSAQFASDGVTVARSAGAVLHNFDVVGDDAYRNPFGARLAFTSSTSTGKLYVGVPGYGPMIHELLQPVSCGGGGGCDDPNGCETERPFGAGRAREEAKIDRRVFKVQEAAILVRDGKLELFDVSGRRTRTPSPGVYFSVLRDRLGTITARRTVLVTR